MKLRLSLIAAIFALLISSCGKEFVPPTSVAITSIKIKNFPESNSSGNPWDGSLQGTLPDVYFKLADGSGVTIYSHPTNLRAENLRKADLPKTFTPTSSTNFYSFDNLDQGISIGLFDYESIGTDEYMGGVKMGGTFRDLFANDELPSSFDLTYGQYSFEVGVKWSY
jgi:hypothetical protein